jgi:hypothetical protein
MEILNFTAQSAARVWAERSFSSVRAARNSIFEQSHRGKESQVINYGLAIIEFVAPPSHFAD